MLEQFAGVRTQLDRACERLLTPSPEALDQCSVELESAVRQLADWQPRLAALAGNAVALEEAWEVRRCFERARRLLHGAESFHSNWMRVRGSMSSGYTPTGEPGPGLQGSRIFLQA